MSLVGSTSGFSFLFIPMLSATGSSLKNSVCSKCTEQSTGVTSGEGSKSGLCRPTKFTHFWYNFGSFLGSGKLCMDKPSVYWPLVQPIPPGQPATQYLPPFFPIYFRPPILMAPCCYTGEEGVLKVGPIYDVTRSKKRREKFRKNRSNSCNFG